ncbi:MAG: Ku protein [Herminiimonas sp.]|uniref:non-homologous end joining protein Ku n=1 Tax=Herminiimonas sp. TaxID=1926289 RepID=UPI00271C4C70|nr:Ku protein [Herminiimonas sp.]MDO9420866.1 Ku protein [Herminiimonas sp.]
MATTSKRVLWKGAISFGLVHIPIALHSATEEQGLNFDWLDKRTMDPVGYKRINKKTGKEITKENIVKGIEYEDGNYVILSPEEIEAAYPKTTQTIEIESFVPANAIPFVYLERPYYISPINKGAKVYALLREILIKTGKVGLAKVVIQTKQHLAVLIPSGPALVLNLLRWGDEIRTWDELDLPKEGIKAAGLTDKEIKMGEQLVKDMSGDWNPEEFTDSFKEQILHLVDEKVKAGETEAVTQLEPNESGESAKIYDLTEMLQRSLKGSKQSKADENDVPVAKDTAKTGAKSSAKPAAKAAVKAVKKAAAKSIAKKAVSKAAPKRKSA